MKKLIAVLACLLAPGAALAQDLMVKSTRTEAAPEPGKALVVFVRSSFVVGAYSAPVLDVDFKGADRMVGVLSGYSKIAYQAEPGEHTFMSVPAGGGPALVAKARLDAGKTYFVLVKPNWGFAPSFTLVPARNDPAAEVKVDSPELTGWLKGVDFYEPTPLVEGWLNANRASITTKKAEALTKWNALPEEEKRKLTLLETDGK